MANFFQTFFDTADFPARWHCGTWSPLHGWIHILADLGTWSAYFAIPCLIFHFVHRRRDVPFPRLFVLFGLFIFACGSVHLVEATIFWWPIYRVSAVLKVLTATVSWVTVFSLIPVIPMALSLKSPRELQKEIDRRTQAEQELKQAHDLLEERVRLRTAELAEINEKLRIESRERGRLAAIVNSSQDAIVSSDLNSKIVSWNHAAEQLYACPAQEAIGKPISQFIPGEIVNQYFGSESLARRNDRMPAIETTCVTRDGSRLDVSLKISPVHDENGNVQGTATIIRDIAPQKNTARELARRATQLAQSNAELERFAYITSHDLREPLRTIKGFSQLVTRRYSDLLDDKGRDFLERIARGTERMDRLIEDVLMLSRVQNLKTPRKTVPLADLVQAALQQVDARVRELEATILLGQNMPLVRVHAIWAVQAIANLLSNALKFTNVGEAPDIEIDGFSTTDADGRIVHGVVVRDRGTGVAPEHAEQIFELFQRAVGREIEGTGAGLAIVKQVAQRHDGKAWVERRQGGGSEFFVTFGPVEETGE